MPAMLRAGYDHKLAAGVICAGGTLGILIPPSVMLILYAATAGVSPIKLYAAAFIPGFGLTAAYIVYIIAAGDVETAPGAQAAEEERDAPIGKVLYELLVSFMPLTVLTFVVLAVIFFGLATPTEFAAMGASGAPVAGDRLRRRLLEAAATRFSYSPTPWRWRALTIYLIGVRYYGVAADELDIRRFRGADRGRVGRHAPGQHLHPREAEGIGVPYRAHDGDGVLAVRRLGDLLLGLRLARRAGLRRAVRAEPRPLVLGFMLMAQAIIFLLGWPLEWTEIIIIFVPIFLPLLEDFGIDPLFFGVMVALNLQTSFLSPPVAMAPFYLKGVAPPQVTINEIFSGVMPYIWIVVAFMVLMYIFPGMALWLPDYLYRLRVSGRRPVEDARMSLCALSLVRSGRRHSRGPHHLGRAGRRLPQAHRGGRRRQSRPGRSSTATTPCGRPKPPTTIAGTARRIGPLHGVPIGIKDIFDTGDMPTEFGSAAVGRPHAAARCGRSRPAARGRRRDHGQDGHHRVRLLPSRQDPQSARSRAHARRLLQRLGRGRGGRTWCPAPSARRPTAR